MVAVGRQYASSSTITPISMLCKSLQMHKEGWGVQLSGPFQKEVMHKLPGSKGDPFGPKGVPKLLLKQYYCHN